MNQKEKNHPDCAAGPLKMCINDGKWGGFSSKNSEGLLSHHQVILEQVDNYTLWLSKQQELYTASMQRLNFDQQYLDYSFS